jgi:TonB-linked SusC/RagA family outer membrane protein
MNGLLKTTIYTGILVFLSLAAFAQSRTVTGIVSNENGNALPDAKVSVKNIDVSVSTDKDGKFSLDLPENAKTLVINFIGMDVKEVSIGKTSFFNVTLSPVGGNIKDVVVIGYGSVKRKDVTSAVGSLDFTNIKTTPQPSVDQLLQGRMAGVQVTQNSGQPGSATSVRIRGVGSIGNSEPLYVIDGVAISGSTSGVADNSGGQSNAAFSSRGGSGGQTAMSPLATLNPADIVSVDVLKDASAQAIYGNRAANGVIFITTRRGRNGESKISYDGFTAFQTVRKQLDLLSLQEYAGYVNKLLATGYNAPTARPEFADPSVLGRGTNWQDALTKTALHQNHNLSVSGGKDQTTYFFSGGITNQDGIVESSNFKRYNLRMNIDSRVKEFLKMGITVNAAKTKERIVLADALDGVIGQAVQLSPAVPVYGFDGKYSTPTQEQVTQGAPTGNPLAEAQTVKNVLERNKVFGSVYAEISFLKDFTFRSDLSGDFNFGRTDFYVPTRGYGFNPSNNPYINTARNESFWWGATQTLTYNKTLANVHKLNVLLGHEATESRWEGFGGQRVGNETGIPFISSFNTVGQGLAAYKGSASLESFFARATYTYDNKYILSATYRRDGSSKFDALGSWGDFMGVSAAWKISEEKFMKNISWFSNAKIRGGYGEVGNQNTAPYRFVVGLTSGGTSDVLQLQQTNFKNPDLSWETAIQLNVGAEFTLLDKVDVTFDVFDRKSKDFLIDVPYAQYLGSFTYTGNRGSISNKGYEFAINSRNITNRNFNWTTGLNFTHIKNTISDMPADIFRDAPIADQDVKAILITQNGNSVSQFYGYKVKDIFRTDKQVMDAPKQFGQTPNANGSTYWIGDIQYEDINNDGVIDTKDKTTIGNPLPKFTVGLTNNFSYKGFDLNVFLTASYGNDVFNILRYRTESMFSPDRNQTRGILDYFDVQDLNNPRNATTMTPKPRYGAANNNTYIPNSDRWVEDGSFLRIQNVTLAYNIPTQLIKRIKLSKMRLYVSGQNLHVFTKYKGLDPEIGSFNQDALVTGVDLGRYPAPRVVTIGANIEF